METGKLHHLRSVVVRFKKRKNRLLIPKSEMDFLEQFLLQNVSTDVVIVNSNLGLSIYYSSLTDKSDIIHQSIKTYCDTAIDELQFLKDDAYEGLSKNFCNSIKTFANYPRLFFSFAKKFLHLREKYATSQLVMPVLNNLYLETIQILHQEQKLPFAEKLKQLDPVFFKETLDELQQKLWEHLHSIANMN